MVACPGCGALYKPTGLPPDRRRKALGECLAAYDSLTLLTLSLGDAEFAHQYAVDAYMASHAGGPAKPIGVYMALAGLYLALERGFNGREVQIAHGRMALGDKRWPTFETPSVPAVLTVREARVEDLRPWMADVWASWSHVRDRVRVLVDALGLEPAVWTRGS